MKKDLMGSLDLLERLNSNTFPVNPNPEPKNNPDNTELTLGLSLNGKYGWDPQTNNNKLSRACSSVIIPEVVDVELSLNNSNNIPLSRTCSLPADEVEWRKRKEMQMLRRSEVKRKRVDQKMKKQSPPLPGKVKSEKLLVRFSSDGSSGGSSGVSDLDSQPSLGTNRDTSGTNEPSNTNKVQGNLKIATNEPVKTNKVQGNPKITPNVNCVIDQTMPCVSTKEDGPDGKRIQGFLYRYGKGEEVRIVCVCHGNFLTPAEFVKHGGGGNVEYPLRHIIVTPLFS